MKKNKALKKINNDYSNFERFPQQPSICDFTNLEKLKWNFIHIQYLGPNVRLFNEKKTDFIPLTNHDLYRINSPYFQNMDLYKKVITDFLKSKSISYTELFF